MIMVLVNIHFLWLYRFFALNFDEEANTEDDGSCQYPIDQSGLTAMNN